ncbi:MAG: hypothetical protein GY952_15295 [Rhodobacteraceae bacterium]|nr:hypothetical protein [Paracoccaceae bacterium]
MKQIIALMTAVLLSVSPASAADDEFDDFLKKFEEFSESTQDFLEGWVQELGPTLEELGPALEELADRIGDWSLYEAPEVLENGDIIIRRKRPKEEPEVEEPETESEPELEDDSIEL